MQYNITYRKKDGGWQYIISFKENGKWKQRSKQGFRTRGMAKVAADKRLEELKEGWKNKAKVPKEYEKITLNEFAEMFLSDEKIHKEKNSLIIYKNTFKKFSSLGDKLLSEIRPRDIQKCIDNMIENGYKTTTVKLYTSKLSTTFNRAINFYELITENPIKNIRYPEEKKEDNKKRALTKAEFYSLLNHIDNPQSYIATFIAGACGLRVGEIMGLTWDNVDLKNNILTVNKQWKRLKDGKVGMGALKTKNSNRVVPIPPKLSAALKKYRKDNPTDIQNRVIIYKSLSSLSGDTARKYKKAGYDISIHDLRHSYATALIANGVDFKTTAKLLGHDVEQTIKTYSHVTDEMLNKATSTVNSIFK